MEVVINPPRSKAPVDRGWAISMVIKSFKGRRDVEVHLFRPRYNPEELTAYDWPRLIGDPINPEASDDPASARQILLETFTEEERDRILHFLKERYETRVSLVTAQLLEFPIPTGMPALSSIPEGKTIGFIRFDKIPSFNLPFTVHGLYDLAQHEPLIQEE